MHTCNGKAIGLNAIIDYLSNIGMNQIHAYEVNINIKELEHAPWLTTFQG
jgi:selenocysteine lyase/cysteine desulfurase